MTLKLNVIICSTRPGRIGPAVGQWAFEQAAAHGAFEVELVDLVEVGLPLFDEPHHPRLQRYEHEHTRRWSGLVGAADAFVFVSPEYNYSPPPSFVNAVDYLFHEWGYKAAGLVTYGGISGGQKAAQMERLMLSTVKVVTMTEQVAIPGVHRLLQDGRFAAEDGHVAQSKAMLDELARWAAALKPMRGG